MTIQLLVSDLDGTLLRRTADGHHNISTEDRLALAKARAAGLTICLASGRLYPDICSIAHDLALPCHTISQNGTAIYLHSGDSLSSSRFDVELALSLLAFEATHSFARSVSCTDERVYIPAEHPQLEGIRKRLSAPMTPHEDLAGAFGHSLHPTKFCYYGERLALQGLQQVIKDAYGDQIDALMTDIDCLDIMPSGTSKGAALRRLLTHLGVEAQAVACVGDQFNDISMFAVTPHSFAMAEGPDEVRAHAAHTVHSVSEVVRWVLAYNLR